MPDKRKKRFISSTVVGFPENILPLSNKVLVAKMKRECRANRQQLPLLYVPARGLSASQKVLKSMPLTSSEVGKALKQERVRRPALRYRFYLPAVYGSVMFWRGLRLKGFLPVHRSL